MTKLKASVGKASSPSRRMFLGAGAAALGGSVAASTMLATPAIAQGFRRIRLGSAWSRDLPIFFDVAQRFADRLTSVSEGRIRVEHFASNELVSPGDLLDATGEGALDAYHAFDYFWAERDPLADLFSSVPFGMTIDEHLAWLAGSGQQHWDAWGLQYGIKPMAVGGLGFHSGLWMSSNGIRNSGASAANEFSIQSLEGLKIRAAGLGGRLLANLGANAVQMPFTRLGAQLESGELDGVSGFVPMLDNWLSLDQRARGLAAPAFWNPSQVMTMGFNQSVWEGLSQTDRLLIEMSASAVTHETLQRLVGNDNSIRTQWHDAKTFTALAFDRDLLIQAGSISGRMVEEMAGQSAAASRAVDDYVSARRGGYIAMAHGNVAFQQIRALPYAFATLSTTRQLESDQATQQAQADQTDTAAAQQAQAQAAQAEAEATRRAQERTAAEQRQAKAQAQAAQQARDAIAATQRPVIVTQPSTLIPPIAEGLDSPY